MTIEELTKAMTYLGMAYNKEFKELEIKQYYEFLRGIDYETFKTTIKSIIKNSKYIPSISQLLEESNRTQLATTIKVFEIMKQNGYFKSEKDYDKAIGWLELGIIPSWLREDMKQYQNQQLLNEGILQLN